MRAVPPISLRLCLAVWALLFAAVGAAPVVAEQAPAGAPVRGITVVIPDEFPPYVTSNARGSAEGERIDMWNLWSKATGTPVTLDLVPWPQVLDTLRSGKADVADLVGVTPERKLYLDYGPAVSHADLALFADRALPPIRQMSDARDMTVGVLARSQCSEVLDKAGIATRSFPSLHDLIYTVVIGKLPVFCLHTAPAAYLLTEAGLQDQYRQSASFFSTTLHWTVRAGETALLQQIDDGFRQIAPSQVAAVTARWSGQATPVIGGVRVENVARLLEVLGAIIIAAVLTAVVLRFRLGRALAARNETELQLRRRIREQACLHQVFIATDNMMRPMADILRDIAEALHKGLSNPAPPLVRIELLGHLHDEIGTRRMDDAYRTPIMIEGKERGTITLIPGGDHRIDGEDALLLGLVASRIAGRALGATTLAMLKKSEERFRRTFQHSAQATAIIQDGRFVNANRAALDLLGYSDEETFIGLTPDDISPAYQPDGHFSASKALEMIDEVLAKGAHRFEWEHLKRNGETVLVEVLLTAVTEDGRTDIFVLWNDITVKRQAEAALAAYQQTLEAQVAKRTQELTDLYDELQAIFATATAGIALVRDRKIVTCNPSLASILLWPKADLVGLSPRAFYATEAEYNAASDEARALIATGQTYEREAELRRFDGSTVWVRMRATAVDPSDPSKGNVWVLEDISSEHSIKAQLAQSRDTALQAAKLKSDFLAHMSHELRSPINAVLGFTELLMGTSLNDHQREFLQKVQTSGRHLLLIVNDVLDLSKVEAGKLRIEQSEFSLPNLLRDATDTITKGVAEKNLELLIEVDPAVPRRLIGDPLRIAQILMNYLTNAVKFTPTGTIRLAITPEPAQPGDAPDLARLRFSVEDSGVGMTDEQMARLFQSFSQAEDSTARLYGGTGLGLAICRQLSQLMGGEVGVSSTAGLGTTFWTVLPLRMADPAPLVAADTRLSGHRLLVIDDHPGARAQIAAALTRSGASVTTAPSGPEAVALAGPARPEAIVVDLKMPGMDGIQTIHALREALGKAMPPTILMTKHGGQEMVDLALTEGIEDLVIKPVDSTLLVTKIAQLLDPQRPRTAAKGPRPRKAPARGANGARATKGKRALVIDDNPINRELTAALLGKHGLNVETAENGADGLERLLGSDFDVVFMDNQMPVMGGLEATRRIRALPTGKGRIPIIGLTGRAEPADHRDGLDAGMNAYLVKPVSSDDLQTVLDRWLLRETAKGTP